MQENSNNFKESSFYLIYFLYKKRIQIIAITGIGALISIIVSLLITPEYKSQVIMYPTSSASVSKSLLTNDARGNLMAFGEEEETEQLLQILESELIVNRIVDKYDLMKHYGIDSTSKFKNTALYQKYNGNISFSKTPFQSIKIEVTDIDPVFAANIANDIADLADTAMNVIKKKRAWDALLIVEYEYKKLEKQINEMSDSLSELNKMGVLSYSSQVEAYTTGMADGIARGTISQAGIANLESKLKALEKYGHTYNELTNYIELEQKRLSELKAKWVEAGVEYGQKMSYKFVVNKARPSEKKAYPVRWLIVSLSTIATFIFAIAFVAFIDFYKNFIISIKSKVNK
jgi:uncharacterized protein involved in exopolysaccharide biosynthesis